MENLAKVQCIDWEKMDAFHMDEYIRLDENDTQTFGDFLLRHIFDKGPFRNVYFVNSKAADATSEGGRYEKLLLQAPVDIICMGIGENGHIAFNDPPVAEFDDPQRVKIVELDYICRQQQVNDGCFGSLNDVSAQAVTITIPTFLSASHLFCVVPAKTKAQAVYKTLNDPVSESCPATVLRRKKGAILYLDNDSSIELTS